jgi:Ca2+-transporting ATPase
LSETEAARRGCEYGLNELAVSGIKSPWLILWQQVSGLMVVILIVAAAISALLTDYKDAIAIGAIVVLNAVLGFSQEYRAERALFALKRLAMPIARVRRDGKLREIPAISLVPGDIVVLETGNFLAADCRVFESMNLQTQESALTGESQPVRKLIGPIKASNVALGDRRNMTYMGTFITAGRGLGVVTETGMRTELGRIAGIMQSVEREPTPLQRRLGDLAKRLATAALLIVALIFILGLFRGEGLKLMLLTAVSIAVAAVPEGLPAIVTIALTLGSQRMLRRKALIRKLSAVETLGSVTVICSDKTGTLTENRMVVEILRLPDRKLEVRHGASGEGNGRHPEGQQSGFGLLLAGGALCNDATISSRPDELRSPVGDPTEVALLLAASHFGMKKPELEAVLPRIAEVAFSSERKRMTTVHAISGRASLLSPGVQIALQGAGASHVAFMKGSVESLLDACSTVWVNEKREELDQAWSRRLLAANDDLASQSMRVLGVAFGHCEAIPPAGEEETLERNLTFVGMIGIIDPPRMEVASAVTTCKTAGIRPVMITGDHPLTAQRIAAEIGIQGEGQVISGTQIDRLSKDELKLLAESTHVYARVSPEHKLKIIESLQQGGHIVAMTGDGVNDAPALKKADIGVAMGLTGTEVAKEAADMVLLDDNFSTIVAAVEEGRVIYDNIRKFVRYILATNSGEIWVMLVAPLFGMPMALLPLQILWMNLVTDGLPALALSVEPPEPDTMRRPPHPPDESIFARGMGRHVIWIGVLMGLLSFGVGYGYWRAHDPKWQTMLFTTLTLSQMAHVMAIRSERLSLFRVGLLSNKPLLAAVFLTAILQLGLVYVPSLQSVFRTMALPIPDLALSIAATAVIFWAVELEKSFIRQRIHK